ncbi:MAG: PKD domain-containing protein [Solirubrobacterales bacterium]
MRERRLHHGGLTGLLAALALLASPWAPAAGADTGQVTMVSPGGAQRTLALGALAGQEDVVERSYVLRSADGESTATVTGFSLAALIEAAGADPYGFSYLEVQRPDGGAVMLSREQALAGGEATPVVYATPGGTGFLRPASSAVDLNATDGFEAPQGISVVLRKGRPLQVTAAASALEVDPGEKIDFTAIVERAGTGQQLEFSWYFDDGHSGAGRTARHAFAKPGAYDVVLGVTSAGDEAGASAVVRIQVGEPPPGPNRKGGGNIPDSDAPDHGAAKGPARGAAAGGSLGSTPPTAPAPTPAASTPRFQNAPRGEKGTTQRERGEVVSGELLSGEAAAADPPAGHAPATARTGGLEQGGGGGLPTAAWGLLGTGALLGLGALAELGALARLRPQSLGGPR